MENFSNNQYQGAILPHKASAAQRAALGCAGAHLIVVEDHIQAPVQAVLCGVAASRYAGPTFGCPAPFATTKLEEILPALYSEQFVPLDVLAEAVSRNLDGLRNRYLTPLVRQRRLRLRFPDRKNRPDQAYLTVADKP